MKATKENADKLAAIAKDYAALYNDYKDGAVFCGLNATYGNGEVQLMRDGFMAYAKTLGAKVTASIRHGQNRSSLYFTYSGVRFCALGGVTR